MSRRIEGYEELAANAILAAFCYVQNPPKAEYDPLITIAKLPHGNQVDTPRGQEIAREARVATAPTVAPQNAQAAPPSPALPSSSGGLGPGVLVDILNERIANDIADAIARHRLYAMTRPRNQD